MPVKRSDELVAYSVQDIGDPHWRWRIYRANGTVAVEGLELSEHQAEHMAATVFSILCAREAEVIPDRGRQRQAPAINDRLGVITRRSPLPRFGI